MRKKLVSAFLAAALAVTALTGCCIPDRGRRREHRRRCGGRDDGWGDRGRRDR